MNNIFRITICFSVLMTLLTVMQASAAPRIFIADKTIQFGTVKPGQRVSVEIPVTNTGDERLEIFKIRTSCSCIQTGWSIMHIEPGQTVVMTVQFDSTGKEVGQGYYQLLVYSTDSVDKIVRIPVLTSVETDMQGLKIEPDILDFGKVHVNQGIPVLNITIRNSGSQAYRLLEIKPGPGVDIPTLPSDTIAPHANITIPVTLHSWIREGVFNSNLNIRTSDPSMPAFHCKVRGIIRK
ncbi:MAG: DUF1573 domain-containing protein [Candidatus Auribacterota bacterium]|jgi:hypothetical protein|nr:DUF1573 domain-containing protein [Candidatus Auribacterota bacterium]